MRQNHPSRTKSKAFTLIEMLVVMTIIGLLMALAVPAMRGVLKASQLTTATQMLVDQLRLARQTALSNNRVVEVRFYEYSSALRFTTAPEVAAMESFIYDDTNTIARPLGETEYFPDAVLLIKVSSLSTLLEPSMVRTTWTATDSKRDLARSIGTNYTVYSFRFKPDGSTSLATGGVSKNWFVTVHGVGEAGTPPPNYATVQLDPYNGSLRLYRPG